MKPLDRRHTDLTDRADDWNQHQGRGASEKFSEQQEICPGAEPTANGKKLDTGRLEQGTYSLDARSSPRVQTRSMPAVVLSRRGGMQPT